MTSTPTCQFIILFFFVMNRRHDSCFDLTIKQTERTFKLFHRLKILSRVSEKLPLLFIFMLPKEFIIVHCKAIICCQIFGKSFWLLFLSSSVNGIKRDAFKKHSIPNNFPLHSSSQQQHKAFLHTASLFLVQFCCFISVCFDTQREKKLEDFKGF